MANWFVRPAGGSYGNEDGTSYANAWDGLLNVVWGTGGVVAGDTLYVCGLHVYNMTSTGNIASQADINIISGTSGHPIFVRGDYSGDAGIIWGAYKQSYAAWIQQAVPNDNVYKCTLVGSHFENWFFEDVTSSSWVVLSKQTSIVNCQANAGSFYYDIGNNDLYVHCSDGNDSTGRILCNRFGYDFVVYDHDYITFSHLKYYAPISFSFGVGHVSSYITLQDCTFKYGETIIIQLYTGCDHWVIDNCDISYAGNGIYSLVAGIGALGPQYYTFSNNIISYIGWDATVPADSHAIGLQGGDYGLVEHNEMYHCGDGFVLYCFEDQDGSNNIVRYNYIHDMDSPYANNRAIDWGGDSYTLGNYAGNETYGNIIINCTIGIRCKYPVYEQKFYNNVVMNASDTSYYFWQAHPTDGAIATFKNNISFDPTNYHLWFSSTGTGNSVTSDNNIFYQDTGTKFRRNSTSYSFINWKVATGQDSHSLTSDPLFVNAGGSYLLDTDFKIPATSPCIDAGVNVGLTEDYWGTSVPQGDYPDIGVHEYEVAGSGNITTGITIRLAGG